MDEIVVVWGTPTTVREGAGHLVRAARVVTGLELSPIKGCWSCGSVEHGAPYFAGGWAAYFGCSLTHVGGFVLAAISLRRRSRDSKLMPGPLPVGIDAEAVTADPDLAQTLAGRVLTTAEAHRVGARVFRGVEHAFLTTWTQKEATLKALGAGLVIDLRQVETTPRSVGCSSVRVRLPTAEQDFHARSVDEASFGWPWVVTVVMPDVPRAHRATLRVVHIP